MSQKENSKKSTSSQKTTPIKAKVTPPITASKSNLTERKTHSKKEVTQIIVQYDVGFSNSLFLRGIGAPDLNWDKGIALKNVKADEWVWETDKPFSECEFKILINDKTYELGNNHTLIKGTSIRINPKFPDVTN